MKAARQGTRSMAMKMEPIMRSGIVGLHRRDLSFWREAIMLHFGN